MAKKRHVRRDLNEVRGQTLGYVWVKRIQRKETACANVLRRKMLKCLRNNTEAGEQGGRGLWKI